ncbi:MAG: metal ABC transporter permease, partial [Thiotrichales bacterium]|nr:metal ABC transporter permease [Thiotrichales bacterium]
MAPAFAVGLIVTAVHAPLGIEVLKRGIVFIDLATAQVVGLAIIVLGLWLEDPSWAVRQSTSFGAGIGVALFFRWIERRAPDEQEAVIGSCFILAASVALLVLADSPHGAEELRHVLSGQILFVDWCDIAAFAPIYGVVAALWLPPPPPSPPSAAAVRLPAATMQEPCRGRRSGEADHQKRTGRQVGNRRDQDGR